MCPKATTLWEFESQIPTRQVGVIDHFTIGPRWEKRELHPQRFLCNSFTDCRHTYLIVAFLPYGSGGTRTHNFQVKSPLLYQLSYRPEGFKLSRCWWSLNHFYKIPPFDLWGRIGGHLGNCHKATKKGRKL